QEGWGKAMAKFSEDTSCGLELLALRRGCEGRRKGSIADIAATIFRLIRSGELNPTKALNLTRPFKELERVREGHHLKVQAQKEDTLVALLRTLDRAGMDDAATRTGLYVGWADVLRIT